jgi:hypothetical protein
MSDGSSESLNKISIKTNEPTESLTEGTTHKHPADDQVGAQVAAPTSGKVKERAGASAESLLIRAPCGQVPREEEQRWLQDISFTDVDSETQVDEIWAKISPSSSCPLQTLTESRKNPEQVALFVSIPPSAKRKFQMVATY